MSLVPSPIIWRWPEFYEVENRAQDATGALWAALERSCPWDGLDVPGRGLRGRLPPAAVGRQRRRRARPHCVLRRPGRRARPGRGAVCTPPRRCHRHLGPRRDGATLRRLDAGRRPALRPVVAERFFAAAGFSQLRVQTVWRFPDRAALEDVLRIEFSAATAARAAAATSGRTLQVGYRMHVRRKRLT